MVVFASNVQSPQLNSQHLLNQVWQPVTFTYLVESRHSLKSVVGIPFSLQDVPKLGALKWLSSLRPSIMEEEDQTFKVIFPYTASPRLT